MPIKGKTFLLITNTDYEKRNATGAHKRFLELVKSASKNNKVVLISRSIPELKECKNIKHYELPQKSGHFTPSHIEKIIRISKVLRKKKKDIEYDYAVSFGPADTFCYGISGYKNIATLFREDFIGYKTIEKISSIKLWYFKMLERYAIKHSQKVIVQCEDDKKALIRRYGKKYSGLASRIYVQINNVNASWMQDCRTQKKRDDDIIKIMFIGNFSDNRKGHQLLLPAIRRLINDGYDIKLYVAGDGKQLGIFCDEYKSYKEIVFLGHTKKARQYLSESDFEIVPSLMDSCPNTVLEGISCGVAVYGTDVGGIKDILQDRNYLFKPSVDCLYKFIKNKIDKKEFIDDASEQESIKKRLTFDWGEKILGIIDESNYAMENGI